MGKDLWVPGEHWVNRLELICHLKKLYLLIGIFVDSMVFYYKFTSFLKKLLLNCNVNLLVALVYYIIGFYKITTF